MLRPAQMYEEELQRENMNAWYRPENIYWNGCTGDNMFDLPDNNRESHHFVSVDRDDNILGYISYDINWSAMSAYGFGIISYKKNSLIFS